MKINDQKKPLLCCCFFFIARANDKRIISIKVLNYAFVVE